MNSNSTKIYFVTVTREKRRKGDKMNLVEKNSVMQRRRRGG
jgi:hypothetical protein